MADKPEKPADSKPADDTKPPDAKLIPDDAKRPEWRNGSGGNEKERVARQSRDS